MVPITALVLAVPVAVRMWCSCSPTRREVRPFSAIEIYCRSASIIFGLWGIFVLAPNQADREV